MRGADIIKPTDLSALLRGELVKIDERTVSKRSN